MLLEFDGFGLPELVGVEPHLVEARLPGLKQRLVEHILLVTLPEPLVHAARPIEHSLIDHAFQGGGVGPFEVDHCRDCPLGLLDLVLLAA